MSAFQIFTQPSQQALDTAANVLSGATLQFTLTGTSTPTNAYSDSTLSTPTANPLSANAAGVFIPVFLDPAITYRVVLKTQAGALLQTWDPANENLIAYFTQAIIGALLYPRTAAEIAAGVTPVNYAYPPGNVLRYGTNTTPGTTDMSTAFQNAINANNSVFIPAGTYRIVTGLTFRAGIEIVGEDAAATILLADTAGITVLGFSGAHSNNLFQNFTINGNSKAAIGFSSVSPSQGSSSGLIMDNVRVALCTDKQFYIKFMTYMDLIDVNGNGNGSGSTYGLYLEGTFDSLIRGASLFYDCTVGNIYLTAGCANLFFRGTRAFKNPGFSVARLVYIDGSYNCGFEQCTFETQGNAECTAEVELDKTGAHECIVFFRESYWLGTAATKTRCVKLGATAAPSLVRFDFCTFFKPTGNESVYAVNARQMLLFGSRDITSYESTTYSPATFRVDNGWGVSQMNIPYSSPLEPWDDVKYAELSTETAPMRRITADYIPNGTPTATTAGFGTGYVVRARTPGNQLSDIMQVFGRTIAGVNGGDLVLQSNGGSGLTERAHCPANGGFVVGTAALATNATNGFHYIPTCAGAPTGVPDAKTGRMAMIYDTTNHKFWMYDTASAAWRGIVLT